jgi:hypothetical protein
MSSWLGWNIPRIPSTKLVKQMQHCCKSITLGPDDKTESTCALWHHHSKHGVKTTFLRHLYFNLPQHNANTTPWEHYSVFTRTWNSIGGGFSGSSDKNWASYLSEGRKIILQYVKHEIVPCLPTSVHKHCTKSLDQLDHGALLVSSFH